MIYQNERGWYYKIFGVYGGPHETEELAYKRREMCLETVFRNKPEEEKQRERGNDT